MLAQKPISFDYGYRFFDPLKIAKFGTEGDLIAGLISEEKSPNAIFLGKIAEFDGLMGKNVWFDTKGAHSTACSITSDRESVLTSTGRHCTIAALL